jgi:hypothetical protein
MFNTNGGYSLSDIAAVSGKNNNGGAFGDDWAWIIILLLCGWGNGGFGFGGGRGEGTTREEISYGFDMNGLENGVRGIQQGLCDGFYAVNTGMLNGFNGVQSTLCQGFSGVNDAITQSTIADMQSDFALQTAINGATTALTAQLTGMAADNAACCCELKGAIANGFGDLGYALATQACDTRRAIADSTRDIIDSNNAGVRSILDFLTQDKIATLTAENQSLKIAASQAAQNAFITANQEAQTAELIRRLADPCPVPAYVVPNPNCCYNANVAFSNTCACI